MSRRKSFFCGAGFWAWPRLASSASASPIESAIVLFIVVSPLLLPDNGREQARPRYGAGRRFVLDWAYESFFGLGTQRGLDDYADFAARWHRGPGRLEARKR